MSTRRERRDERASRSQAQSNNVTVTVSAPSAAPEPVTKEPASGNSKGTTWQSVTAIATSLIAAAATIAVAVVSQDASHVRAERDRALKQQEDTQKECAAAKAKVTALEGELIFAKAESGAMATRRMAAYSPSPRVTAEPRHLATKAVAVDDAQACRKGHASWSHKQPDDPALQLAASAWCAEPPQGTKQGGTWPPGHPEHSGLVCICE